MTKVENTLKKRFVKDVRVPLSMIKNPYFEERIKLYTAIYPNIEYQWNRFLYMMRKFDTEQDYFEHYNSVKDNIINSVKTSTGYEEFNKLDMNQFAIPERMRSFPKANIFKPTFDGCKFICFDMKKANFSAMRFFDDSIFNHKDTWEEFIGQFTTREHIIESKYIREASLGNCNPKRHITYEKYIMSKILEPLLDEYPECTDDIVSFMNDEVVIKIDDEIIYTKDKLDEIIEAFEASVSKNAPGIKFEASVFRMFHIKQLDGYILHDLNTGKITTKVIGSVMLPFLCRKLLGQQPKEDDYVFIDSNYGLLSKIKEEIEFTLPYFDYAFLKD